MGKEQKDKHGRGPPKPRFKTGKAVSQNKTTKKKRMDGCTSSNAQVYCVPTPLRMGHKSPATKGPKGEWGGDGEVGLVSTNKKEM